MKLLFWAIVGGLLGTALMDIAGSLAERLKITSVGKWGGNRALGRWALGIFRGHFVHKDILKSSPLKNELFAGWITHYFTGGCVALTYPFFFLAFNVTTPEDHLLPSLIWGGATIVLPWFILYPAFGWGFFGIRAPKGTRPLVATTISHLLYGLGLGIVLNIVSQHWSVWSQRSKCSIIAIYWYLCLIE